MAIPTVSDNPNGLHKRYHIKKLVREEIYYEYRWIDVKLFTGEFADAISDRELERRSVYEDVEDDAEYFVMRLDLGGNDIEHIKACRVGIHAYAEAIQHHLPDLARDLRNRYPLI